MSSPPRVVDIPEPLEEIKPYEREKQKNGSLWSEDSSSIFVDHKARLVGDVVTVTIAESSSATKEATTTTSKSSSILAGIPNFFGLEKKNFVTDWDLDLTQLINANMTNSSSGDGKTVRKGDLTASLTAQVIKKYPNGNFMIRGGKEVLVNEETQIIYLTGIIRPVDITAANTVDSSKILNARISYTGKGVVSDKQRVGWLTRIFDTIWPF
jgi:flagellar L-ring protein precursor FlgH